MDKDKLLQKYLNGELGPEEEREALHLFADDPGIQSMLHFEQKIQETFREESDLKSFEVPAGFSDRVMHSITELKQDDAERRSVTEWVQHWAEWLWRPRQVRWRPVYVPFAALLLVVAMVLPYNLTSELPAERINQSVQSVQPVSGNADKVWLRFVFIDENAQSVSVAGDFSDWEPIRLTRQMINGNQVWTGLVSMSRGEHHYMFVRNGEEWVTDPLAPVQREDGFGNKNAVIYL